MISGVSGKLNKIEDIQSAFAISQALVDDTSVSADVMERPPHRCHEGFVDLEAFRWCCISRRASDMGQCRRGAKFIALEQHDGTANWKFASDWPDHRGD